MAPAEDGDYAERITGNDYRASSRQVDCTARIGGDEFVIHLTEVKDPDAVEVVAEKLLETVAAPWLLDSKAAYVSASMGIAVFLDDGHQQPNPNHYVHLNL